MPTDELSEPVRVAVALRAEPARAGVHILADVAREPAANAAEAAQLELSAEVLVGKDGTRLARAAARRAVAAPRGRGVAVADAARVALLGAPAADL